MLQVDDINVGDYITVLRCIWNPADRSWKGDVLRVIAIDLPYIVVNGRWSYTQGMTMDTREWQFKRCSDEYIQAAQAAGGDDASVDELD